MPNVARPRVVVDWVDARTKGPTDFINHGETGFLVEPQDRLDLRRVIEYLLNSPEAREC